MTVIHCSDRPPHPEERLSRWYSLRPTYERLRDLEMLGPPRELKPAPDPLADMLRWFGIMADCCGKVGVTLADLERSIKAAFKPLNQRTRYGLHLATLCNRRRPTAGRPWRSVRRRGRRRSIAADLAPVEVTRPRPRIWPLVVGADRVGSFWRFTLTTRKGELMLKSEPFYKTEADAREQGEKWIELAARVRP